MICSVMPAACRTQVASGFPSYPLSAHMIFSVVNMLSSLATSSFAPARSLIWAPVTTIASSQPSTSTAACRPLPLIFFPPWNPRLPFPTVTGGLDDLGIDDHRRGLGVAALAGAQRAAQPVPKDGHPFTWRDTGRKCG